jgi:hypothetical protein
MQYLGLFEKSQTPFFCPIRTDFSVGNLRQASACLAGSALKPSRLVQKSGIFSIFKQPPG